MRSKAGLLSIESETDEDVTHGKSGRIVSIVMESSGVILAKSVRRAQQLAAQFCW